MATITEIAQQLNDIEENIILIYAFNSTGKTRLSVAYKDLTKDTESGTHAGVYFNAFSEDLFVWDNDMSNNEQDIKLEIKYSSLNRLHGSFTEEEIYEKLVPYNHKFDFYFVPNKDPEKGYDAIQFFKQGDKEKIPIKISRGEERIFVWCFFLALFEVEGWADNQSAHFFIDDPVSSLDEHNIYVTAYTVFDLLEKEFEKRKIVVTSHHFGFLTILSTMLGKGSKSHKFRNNNKDRTKKYKEFILENDEDGLSLIRTKKGVFLYHLRLLQTLKAAYDSKEVYTYHFALLRQVLENISSFLGAGRFSYVLEQIGIKEEDRIAFIVNALSHQNVYYQQIDKPVPDNLVVFNEVYEGIRDTYNFKIPNN